MEKQNGLEQVIQHMVKETVLTLGTIQDQLQASNAALGTIWPFGNGLMMSNLGAL